MIYVQQHLTIKTLLNNVSSTIDHVPISGRGNPTGCRSLQTTPYTVRSGNGDPVFLNRSPKSDVLWTVPWSD